MREEQVKIWGEEIFSRMCKYRMHTSYRVFQKDYRGLNMPVIVCWKLQSDNIPYIWGTTNIIYL